MKKINLLISLTILLSYGGIAQINLSGKANAPAKKSTEKNLTFVGQSVSDVVTKQSPKEIETYSFESFEGAFPPAGWTKQNPDAGTGWAQISNGTTPLPGWNGGTQTVPPGGGSKVAYCTWTTGGATANNQWLISPSFSASAGDSLKFNLWRFGVYQDTLLIKLSTTTNAPSSFTTTLLMLDTNDLMPMSTWKKFAIDLTPYAGQNIYIGFQEKVSDNVTYGAFIALDLVSMGTPLPVDVAATGIDIPDGMPSSIVPKGDVMNIGSTAQSFTATLTISPGGYSATQSVTNLAPGASQQLTFTPNWNPAAGTYLATLYTTLAGDANSSNDTIMDTISIYSIVKKAFAYIAYDPTATLTEGPALFDLDNPGVIIQIADQTGTNFLTGATWMNNKWYASEYTSNNLITIDTITGVRIVIAAMDSAVNGITYDWHTSTLFGVSSKNLFSINPTTGAQTVIGNFGIPGSVMINLACSPVTGQLFGVDILTDSLYAINKTTGAATIIGGIGFNSSYAQDMEFDYHTDICYMAAYNAGSSSGELRTADISTGASTTVGAFAGGCEITGFAIPYHTIAGINELEDKTTISMFPNPAKNFVNVICSENILNISLINVFGQLVLNKAVDNTAALLNTTSIANGMYVVQIETRKGIINREVSICK